MSSELTCVLMCGASLDLNKSSILFDGFELREENEAASFPGRACQIQWALSWPTSHPSTKFCGVPFSIFFSVIPLTDKQTNCADNIISLAEEITVWYASVQGG